jgi:hypothetical protein
MKLTFLLYLLGLVRSERLLVRLLSERASRSSFAASFDHRSQQVYCIQHGFSYTMHCHILNVYLPRYSLFG